MEELNSEIVNSQSIKKEFDDLGISKQEMIKLKCYFLACANLYGCISLEELWNLIVSNEEKNSVNSDKNEYWERVERSLRSLESAVLPCMYLHPDFIEKERVINDKEGIIKEIHDSLKIRLDISKDKYVLFAEFMMKYNLDTSYVFQNFSFLTDDDDKNAIYLVSYRYLAKKRALSDFCGKDLYPELLGKKQLELDSDGHNAISRILALDMLKKEEKINVPDDIFVYVRFPYYERTTEYRKLKRFIMDEILNEYQITSGLLSSEVIDWIINTAVLFISDPLNYYVCLGVPLIAILETVAGKLGFYDQERFANLYMDFQKSVRFPFFLGYSENEISGLNNEGLQEKLGNISHIFLEESVNEIDSYIRSDIDREKEILEASHHEHSHHHHHDEECDCGCDHEHEHETHPANKKIGPNDPCPCGSGKKYKKCCGRP